MIKVMTIVGTRPEAIKLAPVIKELSSLPGKIEPLVCTTAQHREMLDSVLNLFDILVDDDLNLMRPDQSLSQLTAGILTGLDEVIQRRKPDWVMVQGDTTTAMVASLVAYYHKVKIGHVEAGLRTGDKYQPFPEEINRRITDALADLYFPPTERSRENLLHEGVPSQQIVVTGNTVIDALLMTVGKSKDRPLALGVDIPDGRRLILVTAHRRENFGAPLENICDALLEIAQRYRDEVFIVYPVHPNPNVLQTVHKKLGRAGNIALIDPLAYDDFVNLMSRAYLVLTDSGGLQEELPSLNKPVLVLRDVTERPEVTAIGAAKLVGTQFETIVQETVRLLEDPVLYEKMASVENPYGDGHASQRIVQAVLANSVEISEHLSPEERG